MGKSSLRVRVGNRLKQEGYRCAALDLTKVGGDDYLSPGQWYRSLITDLNRSLSLLSDADFDAWLAERDDLTSAYVLSQFIEDVVLVETREESVVVFIDEIDNVLSLSFDTTDLFAVIRSCYNERADNVEYARLNFSLLGVATPAQLMRDTSRTPFNIGKAIRLTPLELAQAQPLEAGLVGWTESPAQVLKAIFQWTGGQPYLTQRLCELVQEDAMENGAVVTASASGKVSELVEQHVLKNWQLQDEHNHFKTIQDRMLRKGHLVNRVLALYGQVLIKREIEVDYADEATVELRLSGGVVQSGQTLRPFNEIYKHVFDAGWIATNLANLRPYSETFEAWVVSDCKDDSYLLKGKGLRAAESWAVGKSLSDLDNRYLRESQSTENRTVQKWTKVGTFVSVVVAVVMIGITDNRVRALYRAEDRRTEAETIQIRALVSASKALLAAEQPIEAMVEAVRAVQILKQRQTSFSSENLEEKQLAEQVLAAFQQVTYPDFHTALSKPLPFRERNRLLGHEGYVTDVSFSPDGNTIASSGQDGTIKLWNLKGQELATFNGDQGRLGSVSFSPDGNTIASSGQDGTIKLWNLKGQELASLDGHQGSVSSVSFSPDRNTIASADLDGTIKIWNLQGQELATFNGDQGRFGSVSFGGDGNTIASAGEDGTVKLWNLQGQELATFNGHRGLVADVSF